MKTVLSMMIEERSNTITTTTMAATSATMPPAPGKVAHHAIAGDGSDAASGGRLLIFGKRVMPPMWRCFALAIRVIRALSAALLHKCWQKKLIARVEQRTSQGTMIAQSSHARLAALMAAHLKKVEEVAMAERPVSGQ